MASVIWSWQDFWNWFEQIESANDKAIVLKQIDADWVKRLTAENQAKVFQYAPQEITGHISHLLHTDVKIIMAMDYQKRMKKLRR